MIIPMVYVLYGAVMVFHDKVITPPARNVCFRKAPPHLGPGLLRNSSFCAHGTHSFCSRRISVRCFSCTSTHRPFKMRIPGSISDHVRKQAACGVGGFPANRINCRRCVVKACGYAGMLGMCLGKEDCLPSSATLLTVPTSSYNRKQAG